MSRLNALRRGWKSYPYCEKGAQKGLQCASIVVCGKVARAHAFDFMIYREILLFSSPSTTSPPPSAAGKYPFPWCISMRNADTIDISFTD